MASPRNHAQPESRRPARATAWFASSLSGALTLQPDASGPVDPTASTAPWSVRINVTFDSALFTCSGSIIDATHVLTAAHCTTDENGAVFPTSDYTITAGTASMNGSQPTSQQSGVSAASVFPGYLTGDHGDDLAVLTLSSPLAVSQQVASIPTVGQGAEPAAGSAGVFYGWGQSSPGVIDGNEHYLPFTFESPLACASGLPSVLCAQSTAGDSCPGDSGAGLTVGGTLLVGVLDFAQLPSSATQCTSGHYIGYTDLASPEIAAWLAGASQVQLAPRTAYSAILAGDGNAGGIATCAAPAWSDGSNTGFVFFDAQSLAVLQSGPQSTFLIPAGLTGRQLSCAAQATSAGGTTYATASGAVTVATSINPGLSLTLTHSGRLVASAATQAVVVPLTLTVTSATGAVVFSVTFSDSRPYEDALAGEFATGSYVVCLSSRQTGVYAPASTCLHWVQNGITAGLIAVKVRSAAGRALFTIRTRAPLRGRNISVRWFASSCCARGNLLAARTLHLGALSTLVERARGHGRRFALVFVLPTLPYRGATLHGSSRATLVYELGGRTSGWRPLGGG